MGFFILVLHHTHPISQAIFFLDNPCTFVRVTLSRSWDTEYYGSKFYPNEYQIRTCTCHDYVKQSYYFMDKSDKVYSSMNMCLCLVAQDILLWSQKSSERSERASKIFYFILSSEINVYQKWINY